MSSNFYEHPLQPGWKHQPHRSLHIGDFLLESGELIHDFTLSYVIHGSLNSDASNAILVLCAIGTTHHRLDFLIGPGQAFDSDSAAVIAIDAIGNGLSTSPSNSICQPGMMFPRFTIRDMVKSQQLLVDHLGINQLRAVAGASMGGMQALQWGVSYPERVRHLVAMTPMAATTPWSVAVNETARRVLAGALESPACTNTWEAWVPLMQLLSGRTPESVNQEFVGAQDTIGWIQARTKWWQAQQLSPIDWVYQSWAYDTHDVGNTVGFDGDTRRALRSIRAKTLVLAPPLDLYNPVEAAKGAAECISGAEYIEIPSCRGHQAASASEFETSDFLNRTISSFLGD